MARLYLLRVNPQVRPASSPATETFGQPIFTEAALVEAPDLGVEPLGGCLAKADDGLPALKSALRAMPFITAGDGRTKVPSLPLKYHDA